MVILLSAYLYKKFGHRLKFNAFFQKRGALIQLQPVNAAPQIPLSKSSNF